jgi:hypothetical protein
MALVHFRLLPPAVSAIARLSIGAPSPGAMRKTLTIHAIILACPVANALMRPQPLTKTKSNQIN